MSDVQLSLPTAFISVSAVLPDGAEQQMLGYEGSARFVGFFWDEGAQTVLWDDGIQSGPKHGQSFTFMRFIQPLSFLYGVNLGTHGATATHMFVWDREKADAYVAPRSAARDFMREHAETPWRGVTGSSTSSWAQIPEY